MTSAMATGMTVTGIAGLSVGNLTATVTSNSASSPNPVQVATLIPVVTPSSAGLAATATSVTIHGFGFDPTAAHDAVSFSGGVTGTVSSARPRR